MRNFMFGFLEGLKFSIYSPFSWVCAGLTLVLNPSVNGLLLAALMMLVIVPAIIAYVDRDTNRY